MSSLQTVEYRMSSLQPFDTECRHSKQLNKKENNDLEVAHPRSGSSSTWLLGELELGNVGFRGEGQLEYPEKNLSTYIWIPKVITPNIWIPNVITPNVWLPNVVTPNIWIPNVITLNIWIPNVITPKVWLPNVLTPNIWIPNVVNLNISIQNVLTPNIFIQNGGISTTWIQIYLVCHIWVISV